MLVVVARVSFQINHDGKHTLFKARLHDRKNTNDKVSRILRKRLLL